MAETHHVGDREAALEPEMTMSLCKDLSIALARFPRVSLGHLPTPLEPMDRLSEVLGGPRLWVKRDDCTGLATGGNKTRKLEFTLGEALAALEAACPPLAGSAVQSGRLTEHFRISVNGRHFASDPDLPLAQGDTLILISAEAGG